MFRYHDLWMDVVDKHQIPLRMNVDCPVGTFSSLQLAFLRSLKVRPLMILVFRASANCPTVGLFFEPQCKRITPNVFSRGSRLRFRVVRYLKPASFYPLHTCRTAPILTSHPLCDGGGLLKVGLPSLGKVRLLTPTPALSQ